MTLLQYKRHWINALGTYDFFKGVYHSSFWTIPERDLQLYHTMKDRMVNTPENHLRVPLRWVAIQDLHRDMVVRTPEGHAVDKEGYVTLNLPKSIHKAQPAPLLEGFLAFSGGTYKNAGPRGMGRGGASSKGFQINLAWARQLMYDKRPKLTAWDYRKVLAECKHDDVVYLDPPYKNANVKSYDDKTIDFPGLVRTLLTASFKWMLSEYPNKVYQPLTKKFGPPVKFKVQRVMTNANHDGTRRKWVTECVWRNFT